MINHYSTILYYGLRMCYKATCGNTSIQTFGVCGVSKSLSFLKVLCGGVSGQSGIGELEPSPSSWVKDRSGEPLCRRDVFLGDGEQLVKITLLGDCMWDGEPKLSSSQSSTSSSPPDWFSGLLPSSRLSAGLRRVGSGESISVKPDSPPVLLLASSMRSSSPSLDVNCNF